MLVRMIREIKVPRDRLDAFWSSFSTSRRCSRNRSPSRLPVSPMYNFLQRVQNLHSLHKVIHRRNRETAWRISLRWPIHIINPVDKTNLPCYTSHRRSTTVSLEPYPYILRYHVSLRKKLINKPAKLTMAITKIYHAVICVSTTACRHQLPVPANGI